MATNAILRTFRDPAGSLFFEGDRVFRAVSATQAAAALGFLNSSKAREWVRRGRLIGSSVVSSDGDEVLLEHPRVWFPSYPWEWSPSAWVAAAELTLSLCEDLIGLGLILKDATPLNILFRGTEPVLVDVLSIEQRDPGNPIWLAYAQFVRTFLLPLAAYRHLGWPLATSLHRRDGYEPADLRPYLGPLNRWREPFRSLVTLPLLLDRPGSASSRKAAALRRSPEVATAVLRHTLRSLHRRLRPFGGRHAESAWSAYPRTADHYSQTDHERKRVFLETALARLRPSRVLDIGANTGEYSRLAASLGADVVALDSDVAATERNWMESRRLGSSVLPLIANFARPTPPAGWRNAESLSLLDRARGRFDCILMVGIIHHLLLIDQIPLPEIMEMARHLTTDGAIVEWVPSSDPRFADLVRGRDAIYSHLNEEAFRRAWEPGFTCNGREELSNGRLLYLLQRRP